MGRSTGRGALRVVAALTVALAASVATPAFAQPRKAPPPPAAPVAGDVEGTVVAIQGEELVVDLSAARGASDGAVVEIWRPLKLKHPVTGKVLTDRFRIGALELVQVRGTLSLAKASGALTRPAEVGDIVVLARAVHEAPAAPKAPGEPAALPPAADKVPEDPDARAVTEMFEALRGADLTTRVKRYEEHAQAHPKSRFVHVLLEEAAALRELMTSRGRAAVEKSAVRARGVPAVQDAVAGSPLRLAVELNDAAVGAVLHVRRSGAKSYASLPMKPIGNGYYAASVPGAEIVGPTMEFFIEGVDARGRPAAVLGTAVVPREIDVFDPPRPAPPPRHPMTIELAGEYANYNRMRSNDYVVQSEGTFGVRYGDTGVRAVRLGFGIYRGKGGSVDELDRAIHPLKGRPVGLTYGYLEAEIGFHRLFSIIGRGAVGLIDEGISGGGQALFRIGSDLKTNLLIGGEFLGGVGVRGITQLELAVFERVPILLRTEVTNQPAGVTPSAQDKGVSGAAGSIGGRGIVQVGYRFIPDPELVVAIRGSFQGRTISHAGPGFGLVLGYTW